MNATTSIVAAGLALLAVNGASAAERNRGPATGATLATSEVAASTPAPTGARVDRTVVQLENGRELTVYADGRLPYEDIVRVYGSAERFQFDMTHSEVPSTISPDGTRVYADGAIGPWRDLLGSEFPALPARTVEEYKSEVAWTELNIDGTDIRLVVFADGAMFNDPNATQTLPAWVYHRWSVPSQVLGDGTRVYADGAMFADEPAGGR